MIPTTETNEMIMIMNPMYQHKEHTIECPDTCIPSAPCIPQTISIDEQEHKDRHKQRPGHHGRWKYMERTRQDRHIRDIQRKMEHLEYDMRQKLEREIRQEMKEELYQEMRREMHREVKRGISHHPHKHPKPRITRARRDTWPLTIESIEPTRRQTKFRRKGITPTKPSRDRQYGKAQGKTGRKSTRYL
eukprot:gnl/Carplike_NY0171/1468_a1997_1137.p1 GENE.gnl/Carplike_NY0171/1468_a1997_1137~~gnl/Carplike_NY0171/1468_a1997_1137.p1  ORF type:complete len:189 (-),score=12.87 gnl/Carplike_NY0171/1468_a1997_1137:69-635(-)